MSDTIEVVQKDSQPVLQVSVDIAMTKIAATLADCFGEISGRISDSDAAKAGAPYACYHALDWDFVRNAGMLKQMWKLFTSKQKLSIGIPVSSAISGAGRVEAAEIPAGDYVRAIHTGPYHSVGKTYKRVAEWAAGQGIALQDHGYECYITDPEEVPAAEIKTEILVPVSC